MLIQFVVILLYPSGNIMKKIRRNISLIFILVSVYLVVQLGASAFGETIAEKYKKQGNAYYKARKYNQAIVAYTNALTENMDYAEVFYNRGLVFFDLKQFYKAIVDFDMAIMLNPKDRAAYYSRGLAYSRVGKNDLALIDVKKADKMGDPDAKKLLKSGILTKSIDHLHRKNKEIETLIGSDAAGYDRKVQIISRNNDFGGHTILTVHSKGDPLFDGKDGIFKTIEYLDFNDKKKKTEYLHTSKFNEDNGRNKTIDWYSESGDLEKKEFFYTGKMLNIKGVHYYNKDGQITKKTMFDKHGKEIVRK